MKFVTTLLATLLLVSSSIQAEEANTMATQTIVSRADIQAVAPALDKYNARAASG